MMHPNETISDRALNSFFGSEIKHHTLTHEFDDQITFHQKILRKKETLGMVIQKGGHLEDQDHGIKKIK